MSYFFLQSPDIVVQSCKNTLCTILKNALNMGDVKREKKSEICYTVTLFLISKFEMNPINLLTTGQSIKCTFH